MVVVGCNRTNPNEVEVETYTLCDSIYVESEFGDDYSYYTMNVDLPITKNNKLHDNIMHWMLSDETKDYKTFFQDEKDRFFVRTAASDREKVSEIFGQVEAVDERICEGEFAFVTMPVKEKEFNEQKAMLKGSIKAIRVM